VPRSLPDVAEGRVLALHKGCLTGTVDDHARNEGPGPARPVSYLALGMECDRPAAGSARWSLEGVDVVIVGRGAARAASRRAERGLVVLDVRVPAATLSTAHSRLVRAGSEWVIEDLGSTNGTFVDGARIEQSPLRDGGLFVAGRTLFSITSPRMTPLDAAPDVDMADLASIPGHETLDPELAVQLGALVRLAQANVAVLVRGETGTGKELMARSAHARSGRSGAFVAVNCGAIPATLVESTLFGHVRGAFSGALRDEPGLFRAADGGTLFLDEIGDLAPTSQAALLRALQEREVMPVGATRAVSVHIGVVAATHRPLEAMVDEGTFRRDLYARLAGFVLDLPPLRARRLDLGVMLALLLRKLASGRSDAVRITPAAAEALYRYDWPLNTRELEQCLARALVLAGDGPVDLGHLPVAVAKPPSRRATEEDDAPAGLSQRDAKLRLELLGHLAEHRGNLADVARAMGKARMQVHRWCKRFGIDPNAYRVRSRER
jgi:transcriptional regulator with AAA-type ATPase domain